MRGLASAVIAAIIIGTLYLGREVFVPIALAVLLSFVLAPLVRLLQRWRMPRGLAVVAVVLLAFVGIFMLGGVIATQVTELAGDLPRYQFTMREKIKSLRGATATSGTLERAADVLHDLGKELNKPKESSAPSGAPLQTTIAPAPDAKPIPVEVRQPPPTALESIAALLSPLIHPLTTTGIIAIFVIFMLLQREDLRNRLIKLAGSHDLQKTTAALDDECFVRCRDRRWFMGHRNSQPHLVGDPRCHSTLRALYRRCDRGRVSAGAFGGSRPGMVNAAVDGGALCRRRARSGARH